MSYLNADYSNLGSEFYYTKTRNLNNSTSRYRGGSSTESSSSSSENYDTFVSSKGNKCTDGNDDGKIGILSMVGNTLEGAGKGILNGIKGMFTDSEGNFSLLKTAGTVALGAACVAFPAVGLVACGIGAVSGGAKLVSGVSNAMNATTDAEAKDAWEAVGEGGVTVAASVAGAKASYSAVQSASAAAKGGTSAMGSLGKEATLLQKAGALGDDMLTSTKYNFGNIKNAIELHSLRNKASKIDKSTALTDDEVAILRKTDAYETYATDNIKSQADMLDNAQNAVTNKVSSIKSKFTKSKTSADEVISAADTGEKTSRLSNTINTIKGLKDKASISNIKTQIASLPKKSQEIINFLASEEGTYAEAVSNYGYSNVLSALETVAGFQMTNETI